jgi:V/A-type H+-transporting ATPase subunit I
MKLNIVPLEIIGLKTDLQAVVSVLQRLGCAQIDDFGSLTSSSVRSLTLDSETLHAQEELKWLAAHTEGLLETLGGGQVASAEIWPVDPIAEARTGLAELAPRVQALISRHDELQAELDSLPRYEATLRKLSPIVPSTACVPGNVTIGVLVSRSHASVLDLLSMHVLERTAGRADIAGADVDDTTRAMLLVFPSEFTGEVEALLGREDISRLRLPTELGVACPDIALAALHRRLVAIPKELAALDRELAGLADQWSGKLAAWRGALRDEIDALGVISRFGETETTFALMGWVPDTEVERVQSALVEAVGEAVLARRLALTPELRHRVPIMLQNPQMARPFESLVRLRSLPCYDDFDPTWLMAVFMPILFGMMLGDIGYGTLLLVASLIMLRKFKAGVSHDILVVLAMGAGWSILFGFLFGEFFGGLGEDLGLHPFWFNRASPDNVAGLLLMALAVGSAHIALGLILGVWEAIRRRSRNHLLERGGMLLGLVSLFFVAGVLADLMPEGFMTPAVAGLIVGVVLLSMPMGWMGILIGPVEFIGLIGNVLSYLRIAAIGLASIYLAQVANDMAGKIGSLIVGIIVVVLIHALNLVMGAFSPTIHSLRLHYVEFFRKFYEGGGKPYEPFRSQQASGAGSQGPL